VIDNSLDARAECLHLAVGKAGLHQLAQSRVIGRINAQQIPLEDAGSRRRLRQFRQLLRRHGSLVIDPNAVIEERRGTVVVACHQVRVLEKGPAPLIFLLLAVAEGHPRRRALCAQVGEDLQAGVVEMGICEVEQGRVPMVVRAGRCAFGHLLFLALFRCGSVRCHSTRLLSGHDLHISR
jgi:hypothetical protein